MVIQGVIQSPFANWILEELKPRDFVSPSFRSFEGKRDLIDHIYQFQQKMSLEVRNKALVL